jgi:tetratricopeptide (TPR) repeat protein
MATVSAAQNRWSGARTLPLVSRDELLDELDEVLRSAVESRGSATVIEGEAGIGKTALAHALVERAAASPFVVAWAACPTEEMSSPFAPWSALVESVLGSIPTASRRPVVASSTAEIRTVTGAPSASPHPSPLVRAALIHSVVGVLERAAHVAPLLLVIDDIRGADVASILLAARVATMSRRNPIALLVTARTGDPPPGEARQLALAELGHASATITLEGLSRSAVESLAQRSGVVMSPELIDVLITRTNGNPFFVTELLRLISTRDEHGSTPDRLVATEVPRRVVEALDRRLARLPGPVVALLQAAAVLGNQGDLETVAMVSDVEPKIAVLHFDIAAEADFVGVDGPHWRFTHALVRDALYAGLSLRVRSEIHHRSLEAIGAAAPINDRARHALAALPAGFRDEAVALATKAGQSAMDRLSFEEAAAWFGTALNTMAPGTPARDRSRVLLARGGAERAAGDADASRASFWVAAELAGDDPEVLAGAALGYADPGADLGLAYQATDLRTTALLERALALAPSGPSTLATRSLLLTRLAADLYFSSQSERSRPLAEEAILLARRSGDIRALLQALAVHHDAYVVGQTDAATALKGATEMLELARSSGDPAQLLVAHRARIFDLLASGELAGADAEISAFGRLADMTTVAAYRWWPALWRAMRAHASGQLELAESLGVAAFELGQSSFEGLAATNLSFLAFFLARDRGQLRDFESATREFAAANADIPAIGAAMAFLFAETAKQDEASGALDALAMDSFGRLRDRNWPAAWFQLARAAYLTGARQHASVLHRLGSGFAGECVMVSLGTVFLGSADLGLAWLADALDLIGEADEHYRRAEATNQRLGVRTWLAQARADHARLLLRRGASEDADAAQRMATAARAAAVEIGMANVVNECDSVLEGLIPSANSPFDVADTGLFHREGEIWTLAFAGTSVQLPHAKGLADIARLLATPDQPVSAAELVAAQAPGAEGVQAKRGEDVLDRRARQEIRSRLAALDEAQADAESDGDLERAVDWEL